jgi:hypothetical protein
MAVPVSSTAGHVFGTPVALMDIVEPLGTFAYPYDISPDGQKILTLKPVGDERSTVDRAHGRRAIRSWRLSTRTVS